MNSEKSIRKERHNSQQKENNTKYLPSIRLGKVTQNSQIRCMAIENSSTATDNEMSALE